MEYLNCPKLANDPQSYAYSKSTKMAHNYDLSKVIKMISLRISFKRAAI